jgi:hypothetical protein
VNTFKQQATEWIESLNCDTSHFGKLSIEVGGIEVSANGRRYKRIGQFVYENGDGRTRLGRKRVVINREGAKKLKVYTPDYLAVTRQCTHLNIMAEINRLIIDRIDDVEAIGPVTRPPIVERSAAIVLNADVYEMVKAKATALGIPMVQVVDRILADSAKIKMDCHKHSNEKG